MAAAMLDNRDCIYHVHRQFWTCIINWGLDRLLPGSIKNLHCGINNPNHTFLTVSNLPHACYIYSHAFICANAHTHTNTQTHTILSMVGGGALLSQLATSIDHVLVTGQSTYLVVNRRRLIEVVVCLRISCHIGLECQPHGWSLLEFWSLLIAPN